MSNVFENLPAPAGNGSAAAVDVSTMGRVRTFTVQDAFRGSVNIEFSNESAAGPWAQCLTFTGPGKKTLSIAAQFMRVSRSGVPTVNPGLPNVDVSSNDNGGVFVDLPAPAGAGVGASIDVSALGTFNTVACLGSFGGTVIVEISEDGTDWAQCMTFTSPGFQSKEFVAQFMRVRREGTVTGTPNIDVGAINDAASASSIVSSGTTDTFVYRPAGPIDAPNVFTDFAALHTAALAAQGPKTVFIEGTSPVVIPVGTYDFSNWELSGEVFLEVELSEGILITFDNQLTISKITLRFPGATPPIRLSPVTAIFLRLGAILECTGTGAMISGADLPAGGFVGLFTFNGGTIQDGGVSQPVIEFPVAGSFLFSIISDSGVVESETMSFAVGAIWNLNLLDDSAIVSFNQPANLGTILYDALQRPVNRWFPDPPVHVVAQVAAALTPGTVYKYDTTGGLISQTLPPASEFAPGDTFWFFKTAGAAALDIVPGGGDTINGGPGPVSVVTIGGSVMIIRNDLGLTDWLYLGAGL